VLAGLSWTTLTAFAGTCLVIELTPGPNMAYLAVLSADKGRRAGFAATLGIALGLLFVGIAAAMGLAAIVDNSPWLYESLRWAGTGYLLYLAWEAWHGEKDQAAPADSPASDVRFFLRGLVTNLLNPKAAIFYVTVLPTFVDANSSLVSQAVALCLVYVAIATLIHSSIVMLASTARPWLERPERSTMVRQALALALATIAVWMLVATRRA
jgi:threonine/homoserine/homoserine lactone efflux protein